MTQRNFRVGPWGLAFSLAVAACSNPQGNGSAKTVLRGAFVDHPVEGLAYATATQAGVLDRQGEYRYRAGETVSFRLGDVDLGSAAAAAVLTPKDLGTPRAATNIARLLQTLDADCFAANGIDIPPKAIAAAQGVDIDFDQDAATFAQDDAVEALVAAGRSDCPGLIGAPAADATLNQTIEYMAANGGQPNRLPDATATGPETAAPGATVNLVGTAGDDDGEIVSIQWTELGDAPALTLSNASNLSASFVAPRLAQARTFTLRLRVTDDAGGVADATVRVIVTPDTTPNVPPTASAGLDRAVNEGAAVTLEGVAADADGSVASMTWTQDGGDTLRVTLAGADTASASFTAPAVSQATELHFTFTAVDDDGESTSDSVTITVNDLPPDNLPPVAAAGEDRLALPGSLVQLDGSDSADSDGSIVSHAWSQVAGPAVELLNADGARASFTAPALDSGADLVFRLTVTDDRGATAADDVAVRVRGLQFVSVSGGEVLEGDSGARALGFTISLAQAASEPVTVGYRTQAGTATAGADYTAAQGSVSFLPGDTQKTVTVDVLGDRLDENDEAFLLLLADTGGLDRGNDSAAGLIRDDDQFLFQVGTGEASHDPTGKVCFGSGSMCSRSADPSADGEDAFRKNALGGYDHLISKATAITGANGETFILVTTTNIGYFLAYKPEQHGFNGIYDVRLRIARATGVPSTNIVVVSDHSHNGPDTIGIWGGVSAEYMKITADAVVNSAVAAFESRRPATLRAASVNGNAARLPGVPALDSSYDLPPGNDPDRGNPYNEFRLMTADDAATGERILTFVNYAPHATVTNGDTFDGKYKLTGDWTAWAPQESERRFGGMGVAAIGTVGSTDWNKSGDIPAKEAEARARLNRLIDAATARLQPVGSDVVGVESTFIREPMLQPILLANYKPGLDRNTGDLPQDGMDLRIDRAVNPPFLTGTVVGTYVSAIRIGDVFISTFPGEPFGELDHAIKEQGRVLGAREYFLLGGANDFFGYMVKNPETYQQTLATGALWLPGCPDEDFAKQVGYREEGEGACSDHWTLMVSPTIGQHIVCTLQDQANRLGFDGTQNRDAECPALIALDGMAPPPESGDPLADNPALAREAAVTAARTLAAECAGAGAPAELCAALDEGAKQAAILAGANAAAPTPPADGQARAGVAIKDASWHLGASAGQFAATGVGLARDRGYDPYGHSVRKVGSDTLGTRITTRALVVEGRNGKRVAVVSNDLYLPNDLLHRRTSQLLAEHDLRAALSGGAVTGITDQNLSTTSSHSHTSPFYSTPGWGTWIFQDVMDLRFYEYMARQMADAVIEAASRLVPVRMGGATVKSNDVQAHTYGPKVGQDGTPAGQPRDYTTQALTIVSFEDISGGVAAARPLANWVIFGVHPEWVWGEEIVNGDITHAVMRMMDRETGAVTLWSQRETGSSGPHKDNRVHPPRKRHEFQESNFSGYDRAARLLTDAALRALDLIDSGTPENTPQGRSQFAHWQTGFEVDFASQRVSPPATRPYPGVANCNTEPLFDGHVGLPIVPEPPECGYETDAATEPLFGSLPVNPLTEVAAQLRQAGVPVPDSYGITSFTGVQETMAVHLQVFRLGRIAATMSPNEQFTSQALNLESRLDRITGNVWNGFDWACVAQARGQFPADAEGSEPARHCALQNERYPEDGSGDTTVPAIPGDLNSPGMARARAQIHNDAAGWEVDPTAADPAAIGTLGGEAEPADITQIKGNFTREEFTDHGYDLVVAVGMANDYWGYMAEYREFRAHSDPYRKGLNALGPHGADFVATRLARMAANLNGAGVALPVNPFDTPYQAESQRADATARSLGQAAQAYTAAYDATLPPDGGVPEVRVQPAAEVKRFSAATMQFVGGSNWTDLPQVRVERFVPGGGGRWVTHGTQEGEVQLQLRFLPGLPLPPASSPLGDASFSLPDPQALALWRAGEFEWLWTASFEAFVSELDDLGARPGITPAGKYRFVAEGRHRSTPGVSEYRLVSDTFEVMPWDGITVESLQLDADNRLSFQVGPISTVSRFRRGLATDADTVDVTPGRVIGPIDYPDSYDGGLDWITDERQLAAGDEQYCARCSFRPWADTAELAVTSIPVTVRRLNGTTRTVEASREGSRWVTTTPIAIGETAFVAARTIVDQYGERNGAKSAEVTRTLPPPDRDGDAVPDAADACPDVAGPASNNGCPVVVPPDARDADGDGVADAGDRCGAVPGPSSNAGCPVDEPELADVCDAFGVAEVSPLCDGLRDAAGEFASQCSGFGGPAELCAASAGNLHGAIEACYGNAADLPLPVCRAADAVLGGIAAGCRQVSASSGVQPPELCALVSGALVSEAALQRFEQSWAHRALTLQNRLGYGQRLLDSTLLHTHNSFNAPGENTPQTLSGSDYNQLYGIVDQLRMGIRAIEVDVHWMPGAGGSAETMGFEPKVCHGYTDSGAPHVGCTTEKPLAPVLAEIRGWLDANPGEVVALYLEDHFTESAPLDAVMPYAESARILAAELGDRVYRSGAGCDNADPVAWLRRTRAQIREAGAQVLVFGETCDPAGSAWNAMVHRKTGDNVRQGTQSSYEGFAYPGCALPDDAAFVTGSRGVRWTRVWEDSTLVSNVAGGGSSPADVTPAVTRELMRCGLSLPGFDRLYPADGRLEAAIWSWAPNEPAAGATKNCALHDVEDRFVAAGCAESKPFACVKADDASAWVVAGEGAWSEAACPAGYRFSVPATGYQNERLAAAKRAASVASVWLNYTDAAVDGVWTGDGVAVPADPVEPPAPTMCGEYGLPEALCEWADELMGVGSENPWLERKPLNISHRGGADEFPENTLFAYAESLKVGSGMIEADVYETADGELVVIHDATVDRTTNGTGDVSSFTVAQLKALDAGHCYRASGGSDCGTAGATFPYRGIALGARPAPAGYAPNDFTIPTLRELLERFPTTLINLELKPDPDSFGSYEGKLAAILREYGRTDDVIVASFLDNAALAFKAQAPRVSTSVPTGQVAANVAAGQGPGPGLVAGHDAFQVPTQFNGVPVVDQNFVDDAHANGLAVHVWTIDDCDTMVDLLDLGVDAIMTDRPSLLARVLADRARTGDRSQWVCDGSAGAGEPGSPIPDLAGQCREYLGDMAGPLCDGAAAIGEALAALGGEGEGPGYDQCAGPLCLSQIPLLGDALLNALAPLLAPPAAEGLWLRTDLHVHDDHSSDGSGGRQVIGQGGPGNMAVGDQIAYSETVGLDFLALTDHRTFDQHYDPQWRSDTLLMITGEEANGSPHATVFGAVDMINQSGTPPGQSDARRLQQSIWDAQLQGAVWTHAHPADGQMNEDGTLNDYAEATGQHLAEAWKISTLPIDHIQYCENRWNAGWRFGVAGGSDNHFKELWPVAGPGTPLVRVFAKAKTTAAVLEGLRSGRTTLSLNARAPVVMLDGDFDGDGRFEAIAGDEVKVRAGIVPKLRVTVTNGTGNTVTVLRAPGLAAAPWQTFQAVVPEEVRTFELTDAKPHDWFRVEVRGPGEPSAVAYEGLTDEQDPMRIVEMSPFQLHAMSSPLFTFNDAPAVPASTKLPAGDAREDDASVPLFGEIVDSAFAGFASVSESGGVLHAVAEVRAGGESRAYYRRVASGAFGAAIDLAGSASAREPRVAASGDDVWVVWQDSRAGEIPHRSQIWARHSTDGGLSWEAAAQVSEAPGRAEHPVVALVTPSQPVVAWQQNGDGAFDIWARVLGRDAAAVNVSAPGKTIVAGNPVDSRSAIHPASVSPAVSVKSDGTIAIGWQDNRFDVDPGWTGHAVDPTNPDDLQQSFEEQELREAGTETDDWEILVSQRAAGGASWSEPVNISNAPDRADRHVTLGHAGTGQHALHAAWDSTTNQSASGRNLSIRAARFDTGWSAPVAVDEAPAFSAQRPVFGRNGEQLHLFWMDGRGADWRWRVRRAQLAGNGFAGAADVTEGGNAGWPSYSNGWLAFTGDRGALREQRKPQQVQLLALDSPRAAEVPAGSTGSAGASGGETADLCDPITGSLCLSQVPVIGSAILGAFGEAGGDPTAALATAVDPAITACRDGGLPESLCARAEDAAGGAGLSRYVEPRIGSVAPGFTNPGPQLPFGMVAVGPDTEGPLNYGGYYIHNALVSGFSQVHMSAGVYKGGYFPLLPFTGEFVNELNAVPGPSDHPMPAYSSGFEHATEVADAGYYAVTLARYGVLAELTATERVGLHRYTFNDPAQPARVLLDASRTLGGYRPAEVRLRDAATLSGRLVADRGFPVFFALRASQPFTVTSFAGTALGAGESTGESSSTGVVLDFPDAPAQVTVKIALSYTDEAGAVANLAEVPAFGFAAARESARAKWNAALGRVEVQGGTVAERVSFYSAIYRALQFPNLHSDVDGRYRGPDGVVRADADRPHYSQFSSWDSYRGQNQLQAELFPAEYGDMIRSLLDFHDQAGFLPRWQEGSVDASHMSGDPIIPFIGEAWCRGQIPEPALRNKLWSAMQTLVERRDDELDDLGYLAVPGPQTFFDASPLSPLNDVQRVVAQLPEVADGSGRAGTTLEYGIADFALALMAQDRAPQGAVDAIAVRSQNYRNLIDTDKAAVDRWIQPRLASGDWSPNFLPESGYGFQEGTSWQYSWLAMHDYAGLFELMGGDAAVQQRLDTFFNLPAVLATPVAWPALQNQITAFGVLYLGNQFAPGNEHDVQAPYAYVYAGAPWKAQAVARAAASIYTPLPNGLPGNDDLGALSGWLFWTMAGLYPMNPGSPVAVVGSPHFERVTLKRPGGALVIEAPGASPVNKYVQALRVDGAASSRPWLALPRGASTVSLEMGPAPAFDFGTGTGNRPPSVSGSPLAQFGCAAGAQ